MQSPLLSCYAVKCPHSASLAPETFLMAPDGLPRWDPHPEAGDEPESALALSCCRKKKKVLPPFPFPSPPRYPAGRAGRAGPGGGSLPRRGSCRRRSTEPEPEPEPGSAAGWTSLTLQIPPPSPRTSWTSGPSS